MITGGLTLWTCARSTIHCRAARASGDVQGAFVAGIVEHGAACAMDERATPVAVDSGWRCRSRTGRRLRPVSFWAEASRSSHVQSAAGNRLSRRIEQSLVDVEGLTTGVEQGTVHAALVAPFRFHVVPEVAQVDRVPLVDTA